MEVDKDDYEFESIVYHYFTGGILLLKEGYVDETLGEYNIIEVWFEDLNKDFLVELARYIRNHIVEVFRKKGTFNAWVVNVIKVHTSAIRSLYHVKYIYRGYRL